MSEKYDWACPKCERKFRVPVGKRIKLCPDCKQLSKMMGTLEDDQKSGRRSQQPSKKAKHIPQHQNYSDRSKANQSSEARRQRSAPMEPVFDEPSKKTEWKIFAALFFSIMIFAAILMDFPFIVRAVIASIVIGCVVALGIKRDWQKSFFGHIKVKGIVKRYVLLGFLLLRMLLVFMGTPQEKADKAWANGNKKEAVKFYTAEIKRNPEGADSEFLSRVIEYYHLRDNKIKTKQYCFIAIEYDIDIEITPHELNAIFANYQKEYQLKKQQEIAQKKKEEEEIAQRKREEKEIAQREKEWYKGGTLHTKNALAWQTAGYADKRATCADFITKMWMNGNLTSRIGRKINIVDDIKPFAEELVEEMDAATKRIENPEQSRKVFTNQTVAGMVVILMMTKKWLK